MKNNLTNDIDLLCRLCESIGRDKLIIQQTGNIVVIDRLDEMEKDKKALLRVIFKQIMGNNET